jgi:hypothetical protein
MMVPNWLLPRRHCGDSGDACGLERNMSMPPDIYRLENEFFDLGLQYFVVARFAASEGVALSPVSGTLFHHAVEMLLKGKLCRTLQRKTHDLPWLWDKFKTEVADPSLTEFDFIVNELHKFEDIRYPENIVVHGMTCSIGFGKRTPVQSKQREPRYELFVGELDGLVKRIFTASSTNPEAFAGKYQKHARKYLRRYNRSKATRLW